MTGMGHNDLGMDPDEFDFHVAVIARQKKKTAEAKAAHDAEKKEERRLKGLFKAAGGKIGILEDLMREREDPDWHMNLMRDTAAYGKRMGKIASAFQLDFFDVTDDPLLEKAFVAGGWAGMTGDPSESCPHDASTQAFQRWMEGWHEGREKFDRHIAAAAADQENDPEPLGPDDNDDEDDGEQPVPDTPLTRDDPDMKAAEAEAEADGRLTDDPGGFGDENEAAA